MVLTNAKVYTSDEAQPLADTLVIEDGYVSHVGALDGWPNEKNLPVHDLHGRAVIPGLIDSHTHPSMVSQSLWHVRLPWTTDIGEILQFIREYAEAHPPEEAPFLYFEYYPTMTFRDRQPTKELLDSAISDRPCLCQDFSEHEHWVNSKMLELMEITKATPDPVPGLEMFVRDEDGEPTGLLREAVHRHFIDKMYEKIGWKPPQKLTPERISHFFRFMTEHGVTSLFEALVDDDETFASISELDRRGELNMYYEGSIRFRTMADLPDAISSLRRYQAKYGNEHININTLKLFLDGTNESGNSAVISPMCTHAGPEALVEEALGEMVMELDELTECISLCNTENVDVHIHLVGDRAFRVACDAVEAVQRRLKDTGGAWTIQVALAHCELVDPADMPRPAELGIIINWTTHWSGAYFGEGSKKHLGEERWNRMYRFNEIADSGATITFSSDVVTGYELNRGNPFFGMQVANSRVDPQYPLDPLVYPLSMRPEESAKLSRELLLKGYTLNGAKQMRLADKIGSLATGKVANLCILSEDMFEVETEQLSAVKPDAVIFEGNIVLGSI
jgi:predicted amidohydrolase YtcJ